MKRYMEYIKEAVVGKLKRSDLKIGDDVMTSGYFEDIDLNFKVGKIIAMREYGHLLIEFTESFNKALHAGHNNIGKEKHCLYVPFENIRSNDKTKFEEIIKKEQAYDSEAEWWFSNRGKKV